MMTKVRSRVRGLTLVEVTVVVVVIGILAAFAVPRFLASVERSKASEAFNYLATIASAQERYHARKGTYAADTLNLDIVFANLEYFETDGIDASDPDALKTGWSAVLVRKGAAASFGAYTVVFDQDGFDSESSTITDYSSINPLQTTTD